MKASKKISLLRNFRFVMLGSFCSVLLSMILFGNNLALATYYTKIATYDLENGRAYVQGAAMTKDYYIYTDWDKNGASGSCNGGTTVIVMCKRDSNGNPTKNCKRSSTRKYNHANNIYHVWGTDYFAVQECGGYFCLSLSALLKNSSAGTVSDSKCKMPKSRNMYDYGSARQGYTQYIDPNGKLYYLRAFATYISRGGYANRIVLYDKNFKLLKAYKLPDSSIEMEDVMVDNNTGVVYFVTNEYGPNGKRYSAVYKLSGSVFGQWIKPNGGGSPSSDSGSGSRSDKAPSKSESTKKYTFTPTESQYDGTVETTFFGKLKDPDGCGVYTTLNFVLDLLFVGVGITAIVGISFFGVKYLTARDSIDQAKKARRHIFQILIGVAIYAVIYGLAGWLLADTNFSGDSCKEVTKRLDTSERNDISAKMS